MSERSGMKAGHSKLRRRIALGVLAVIVVSAGAYAYMARSHTANVQRVDSEGALTVYAYNFTPYDIAYSMRPGIRRSVHANSARGNDVQAFGYKPTAPDAPMSISWRYESGPDAAEEGNFPFQVTLSQPQRPAGEVVVELRIYPEGKAAVRYVKSPLVSDFSNVAPELPGSDWVSNR
jgi:hypothetical protein